jgi:ribosome-associated toxin RatA of RatAB toxin-antitoxin module
MAEQAEGTKTIDAAAGDIMEVLIDFESYPEWTDVKSTKIVNTDSEGRASQVAYEVSQFGITAKYTLSYEYADDDGGMTWTTKSVEEGPIKDIEGEYVLQELDENETEVTYSMSLELSAKVPGIIKKRAEKMVIKNALDGLKKRVELG